MSEQKMNRDNVVAAGVAGAAFISSAAHIYEVTEAAGNHMFVAGIHPLGIDGLIYIGIRAMQRGNKVAGGLAIGYGALYSLAFNAASYGGFEMPVWALAACMPLAMFLAFLIVHGSHGKVAEIIERIVEVEKIVEVPGPEVVKYVEIPTPTIPRPRRRVLPQAPVSGGGRGVPVTWDVETVVDEVVRGADVSVDVSAKNLQRTKRIVRLITEGGTDADVANTVRCSVAHVARVRAAMEAKEEAK